MPKFLPSSKVAAAIVAALALLVLPMQGTLAEQNGSGNGNGGGGGEGGGGGPGTPAGYDFCIGPGPQGGNTNHGHQTCFKSSASGSTTEVSPSRCNGELGFWMAVPMPNGETFCVARSTAGFYGNVSGETCRIDVFRGAAKEGHLESTETIAGQCP